MDKVLSTFSLLSVIWSNILLFSIGNNEYFKGLPGSIESYRMCIVMFSIYLIVLTYNIFTISFCLKLQREKQTSKIPVVISKVGTLLFLIVAIMISLAVSIVEYTGGV